MKVCVLASGSKGNVTYIETNKTFRDSVLLNINELNNYYRSLNVCYDNAHSEYAKKASFLKSHYRKLL